jgi:hypothetical protein
LEQLREAIAAFDYQRAWTLIVEAARAGSPPSAEIVAPFLNTLETWPQLLAMFSCMSGDRGRVMLEVAQKRRFPRSSTPGDLQATALYLAWRFGDRETLRRPILVEARILARRGAGELGLALLFTLGDELNDEPLQSYLEDWRALAVDLSRCRANVDRLLQAPLTELPTQPPAEERTVATGFTVRTGPKVGRNDPCPCQSGKKYKKCCIDKQVFSPSPVAGLSWDEYLRTAGDRMSFEDVSALGDHDFFRLDTTTLKGAAIVAAFRRASALGMWDRSEALVARLDNDFRDELIDKLLSEGELERARRQLALLTDDPGTHQLALELAVPDGGTLRRLLDAAEAALRDPTGVQAIELAYALLDQAPALGILATEGVLRSGHPLDSLTLREEAEDARDRLLLPPGRETSPYDDDEADDFEDDDLDGQIPDEDEDEDDSDDGELENLRRNLAAAQLRIRQLEDQLRARRAQHDEPLPAPTPQSPDEMLRAKIAQLKAIIREGNQERAELRRQLSEGSHAAPAGGEPRPDPDENPDGDAAAPREILLPKFSSPAAESVRELPQAVARGALRLVGALAAGDAAAWKQVKQAKDMGRPLFMARVGIHHRLLFQVEDGTLEALQIIPRESLDLMLKKLRAR